MTGSVVQVGSGDDEETGDEIAAEAEVSLAEAEGLVSPLTQSVGEPAAVVLDAGPEAEPLLEEEPPSAA
jgi:hypothetical protein